MTGERAGWRIRPVVTAAIGLACAIIVQQLLERAMPGYRAPGAGRVSLATGVGVAGMAAILTIERSRAAWSAAFAAACGVVAALVTWWNGGPADGELFVTWRTPCLFLAIAIAGPLFQAARDAGRARFDYAEVHGHAWTDVVLWCAGIAFTGIAFALAWLLASLFDLIGIHLLRDLLRQDWAGAALAGAAFGGGVGLLRERDRIVRTLQRVVTGVLSVLAPVLGAGLALFLLALPFTGLGVLWEATKATTPILLTCVIGAIVLVNAVIADGEGEEATNPALRWGAIALVAAMLPLSVIAALATGLRIDQYGLTPDRLWALTFVVVACACATAYLVSLARGRGRWAARVRPANLTLAFGLAGVALLLATPVVGFNAMATRDQVARLEGGRIPPGTFDWRALAFDFGAPGRRALARLARSPDPAIARLARDAATKTNRYEMADVAAAARSRERLDRRLRILPARVALPIDLRTRLVDHDACGRGDDDRCTVLYRPGAGEAIVVREGCLDRLTADDRAARTAFATCDVSRLVLVEGTWRTASDTVDPERDAPTRATIAAGLRAGAIEVRPVARRQVFVGGEPVGAAFD